ncbi:ABC transporter ATP-binding protein [Streptomyces longisporoflavus]|uniref:ATP-binding cassette domain-containing protein n=1 Tax=Streptomyces longisporoflavus TaxID=28044 RepID=UPI00167C7C7D|nr:ABC transporter ATP-binding protein [Streptomyces longisporoflavus]GGV38123.1 ABC transporter ATP-binding protein [Streptomyces longisporoflavus]
MSHPALSPTPLGTYRRGVRFLWRRWPVLLRLALWSVLETGQTFLTGYALARALDDGFLAGRAAVGFGWLGGAGLGVLVAAYGTGRVFRAVADLVEPLRDSLVRQVVGRGLRDADSGSVSRLTQQVEIARDTFAGLILVSRSFVFTAAGALIGLFSLAPLLLLVVAPPLFAGIALFAASLRPLARRQERFLVADEAIATQLGAVAPGLRDIAAAGAERDVAGELDRAVATEYAAAGSLARWGVLRTAALVTGGQLPLVLLLATAPWLLNRGVTPGALVGAIAYVTQALLPALNNLIHGLGTSGSRLAIVLRRLTWTPPPTAPEGVADSGTDPGAAPAGRPAPALQLSSVTFAYGPLAEPVLRDLSLTVPGGGHLAVVGPSGIGKSTLAGLVAGMLEPGSGVVRVDGRDVRGPDAVGRRVLIPQEAYVFSGTLRENLEYLRGDGVGDTELLAAADAVGLGGVIERLGGLGAPVDPAALSAGERQLVALTRAHVSYAPLALLDEATCHLDPAAEARAERAFAARPGGTLVVIAHRISSARRADRILVMDGSHTECGSHEELLESSPLYRELSGSWGPANGTSHPALDPRDPYRVDPVAGPGLTGDGGHVVAHRPVGQMQTVRDLGDRRASGGEREDQ